MTLAIGVDIGGTKVAAGVVDPEGKVLARARRRTPSHDPEHIVDVVVEIVRQLRTEYDAVPVGIGAAGYIDAERSHVLFAPNLPGWRNTPLREQVSERLDSDVIVENDAHPAAWGEYRLGGGDRLLRRGRALARAGDGRPHRDPRPWPLRRRWRRCRCR